MEQKQVVCLWLIGLGVLMILTTYLFQALFVLLPITYFFGILIRENSQGMVQDILILLTTGVLSFFLAYFFDSYLSLPRWELATVVEILGFFIGYFVDIGVNIGVIRFE